MFILSIKKKILNNLHRIGNSVKNIYIHSKCEELSQYVKCFLMGSGIVGAFFFFFGLIIYFSVFATI